MTFQSPLWLLGLLAVLALSTLLLMNLLKRKDDA